MKKGLGLVFRQGLNEFWGCLDLSSPNPDALGARRRTISGITEFSGGTKFRQRLALDWLLTSQMHQEEVLTVNLSGAEV